MAPQTPLKVVVVGGGFGGLRLTKALAGDARVQVTLLDRRNHHLFQPLLYQVATASLSPAEIAVPMRSVLNGATNVDVRLAEVTGLDLDGRRVQTDHGDFAYDRLVLACGAQHSYFGREDWETFAPGLKTLEQATEIRRRVLNAFEEAENTEDAVRRRFYQTFVVVGGGPTGVELAGAFAEINRFALGGDFRRVRPDETRVFLLEAGPRILPSFPESLAARAVRDLSSLGVSVLTSTRVTNVDAEGVEVQAAAPVAGAALPAPTRLAASTIVWAAGVQPSPLNRLLGVGLDRQGRVPVGADLSLAGRPEVFVLGDQAHFEQAGQVLPGVATVAMQQGSYLARTLRRDARGQPREPFRFKDKGQMATIGRSRGIVDSRGLRVTGWLAWMMWLLVHIYYLIDFRNRLIVLLQWAWSYATYGRGARLILSKEWRSFGKSPTEAPSKSP